MKKVVSYLWMALVCCVATLISFTSCESSINEDYDLSKDIDLTVSGFQGVAVPIGNVAEITVNDLISLTGDGESEFIYTDEEGDLYVRYAYQDRFGMEIKDLVFGNDLSSEQIFEPFVIEFPLPYFSLPESEQGVSVSYSQLSGSPLSVSTSMNYDAELPEEVVDVKYVDFHKEVTLRFDSDINAHLKSGFRIQFPEYVVLQNFSQYPEFVVEEDELNTIVLVEDVPVPNELSFYFCRVNVPEGSVSEGKLKMELEVKFEGDMYVNSNDLANVSRSPQITISMDDFSFDPSGARVKVDYEFETEDIDVEINGLPDFMTSSDLSINLYDPRMYLTVENFWEFSFGLQAGITASYKQDPSVSIVLDPMIEIAANTQNSFVFSAAPVDVEPDVRNIVDPAVKEMFSKIPEKISIHDTKVSLSDDFFDVSFAVDSYLIGFEYGFDFPLSFDLNTDFQFVHEMDIADVAIDAVAEYVELEMDVVNSIPLGLELCVEFLDAEGNAIDWLRIDPSITLSPGTQKSPVTDHITCQFRTDKEYIEVSSLKLYLKAGSASEEHAGVPLNKEQGLEIKNITLSVPGGLTINLENF